MRRALLRGALLAMIGVSIGKECIASEVHPVRGANFEGAILTPDMMSEFRDNGSSSILSRDLWTPSADLIREAELRLGPAVAQRALPPKTAGFYYVPQYFTPKAGSPVSSEGHQRLESDVKDSHIEENFLREVAPILPEFKRQYLGVTVKGKKYVLLSFIHKSVIDGGSATNWRDHFVVICDGEGVSWSVMYDPITRTFSGWRG